MSYYMDNAFNSMKLQPYSDGNTKEGLEALMFTMTSIPDQLNQTQ